MKYSHAWGRYPKEGSAYGVIQSHRARHRKLWIWTMQWKKNDSGCWGPTEGGCSVSVATGNNTMSSKYILGPIASQHRGPLRAENDKNPILVPILSTHGREWGEAPSRHSCRVDFQENPRFLTSNLETGFQIVVLLSVWPASFQILQILLWFFGEYTLGRSIYTYRCFSSKQRWTMSQPHHVADVTDHHRHWLLCRTCRDADVQEMGYLPLSLRDSDSQATRILDMNISFRSVSVTGDKNERTKSSPRQYFLASACSMPRVTLEFSRMWSIGWCWRHCCGGTI